jgi:hypothetical protein
MYVSKFEQLACDISWGEVTFMIHFGFCGNMKYILLTMPNPTTLNQAIV